MVRLIHFLQLYLLSLFLCLQYPCIGKISYAREDRTLARLSEADIRSAIVDFARRVAFTGKGAQDEEGSTMQMGGFNMDETLDDIAFSNTQDSEHSMLVTVVTITS